MVASCLSWFPDTTRTPPSPGCPESEDDRAAGGIEVADRHETVFVVGEVHAVELARLARLDPKTAGSVLQPGVEAGFSVQLPEGAEGTHGLRLRRAGPQAVSRMSAAARTLKALARVCGCPAAGRPERRTAAWPRGIRR